jgi:hypothetical protein
VVRSDLKRSGRLRNERASARQEPQRQKRGKHFERKVNDWLAVSVLKKSAKRGGLGAGEAEHQALRGPCFSSRDDWRRSTSQGACSLYL